MSRFCDVAVPVPLDAAFTYSLPDDLPEPCVGGRVIVPFREKRLSGIVTEVHDREPNFKAKPVQQVLDATPALTPELMQLGRWIAQLLHRAYGRSSTHHAAALGRVSPCHRISHH